VYRGFKWIFRSVVAMIRPVIPGRTRHSQPELTVPALRRPLPLPVIPPPPPRRTRRTVYRTATLDDRGRITHRAILETLGWTPKTRLTGFLLLGRVIFRPDPSGTNLISPQGRLTLVQQLRRALLLRAGSHVLLAAEALPASDTAGTTTPPQAGRVTETRASSLSRHEPANRPDSII